MHYGEVAQGSEREEGYEYEYQSKENIAVERVSFLRLADTEGRMADCQDSRAVSGGRNVEAFSVVAWVCPVQEHPGGQAVKRGGG